MKHPLLWRSILAATFALCLGCPRNPATGARQLDLISTEQEIQLGKQGVQDVSSSTGFYDDRDLQRYVEEVGMKLAKVSERPNLPWSFQVVDDAAVNAFALPGGPIFVTRGLLAHLKSEAQLAIVLGHEIGHITAQHSVNQLSKAQLAQVGIGLSALVSEQLAGLGAGGLQLLFLKFGRDDERQSDQLALRYAERAGYDVRVAPEVFEVLRRVSEQGEGGRLPAWLATHPDPEERAKTMRAQLAKQEPKPGARVEEERFLRALDGITYGDDPREGIVRENRFFHPGMRFQITFPQGFRVINGKEQVAAEHPEGVAAMALSLAPPMSEQAALQRFFKESGAQPAGPETRIGGAVAVPFEARTEQGQVAGAIAFMARGNQTFQFLLLSSPERATGFGNDFRQTVESFGPLEDPELLNAQPARLKVEQVPAETPLKALQSAHPALSVEELARVNQLEPGAVLPRGALVKWVAGRS